MEPLQDTYEQALVLFEELSDQISNSWLFRAIEWCIRVDQYEDMHDDFR